MSGKPRRRSLLQRVRDVQQTIERLQSFDWDGIQKKIAQAERAVRTIHESQRLIADALLQDVPKAPLISPLELASGDRFVLENRCRALTSPVYLGDHTALCWTFGLYKIYVDTTDTGFASHVLLDGFWEMWLTIFFARQLKPGMTVIDVGANYGYYTLLFGALVGAEGHVFAVEPNPAALAKLRRSVEVNGLTARTTIIEAAAGNTEGEVALFVPHGEPKNSTIVAEPHNVSTKSGTLHTVPAIKLNQIAALTPRVDLVKIDAEGAEQDIIAGMDQILRRDQPVMLLEFNAARYADPSGFLEMLMSLYGRMRYIDYDANAVATQPQAVLSDRSGQDWLLLFDNPGVESSRAQ